jgi:RimJ/RimL family protein N-acetyltransferase
VEIRLREWTFADAAELARLANNRKIWDNARDQFPHPYTVRKADEWIAAVLSKKPICNFAITVDGKLAGAIGIMLQEDVSRCSAELGYWVGEPFWNQGVATLAIMQILPIAWKSNPGLTRIFASVFDFNKASMRALEKSGFQLESIRKKAVIKNGVVGDDYIWVLLRD